MYVPDRRIHFFLHCAFNPVAIASAILSGDAMSGCSAPGKPNLVVSRIEIVRA